MATADQYAEWIVTNAAKKGTPEFDTVAQAYQLAKSEETTATAQAQAAPLPQEPGIGQQLIGAGETALTLGTGATGGLVGGIVGAGTGLAQQILSGQFGTPEAVRAVEKSAVEGAQALTYQPRTQAGQEQVQAVGQALSALPPVMPMLAAPGQAMQAVRNVAPLAQVTAQRGAAAAQQAAGRAGQAIARPVQAATTAVRETLGMEAPPVTPATAAGRSAGAAATPLELQRSAEAEMAGLRLSEGEVKRDPQLLAFEKEKAKTPDFQEPFLVRQQENNRAALGKLNQVLDDTGAESGDYSNTGIKVVDTLMAGWGLEKKKTGALYEKFRASPEAQIEVDATPVMEFLNSQSRDVPGMTGVPDVARQNAVNLGIAKIDENKQLIPTPGTTLGQLEEFRQSVSAIGATNPNDKRLSTIIKRTIDEVGDPIGGEITKAMRAQRKRQATKYEDRAIVARLLLQKKGMSDAQTPIEDVFRKTILTARPSEIQHLKRVLSTIPDKEGQQAWKELQGATVRNFLEKSESGIGSDNLPVISGAKLDKAIKEFDQNGKLDQVMGVQAAEQIRNLNQVLKYIQSTPPMTSINNSGTARTVAALLLESAGAGLLFGVPVPVVQGMKMLRDNIKDRRIKIRITKALNYKPSVLQAALPIAQP
jgi:hypothetical protein